MNIPGKSVTMVMASRAGSGSDILRHPWENGILSSQPTESGRAAQIERSLERAALCAKVADEYRGENTLVLDLTAITPIVDFFVITSATSRRQMHAVADEADRVLKADDPHSPATEGYEGSTWILQDYGDVVLHIFSPEARRIYDLEHLWADAARIDWRSVAEGSGVRE